MVFVQKWPFFQLLFFRKYTPGKCLLQSSRTKKRLSRLKKQKVEKSTFFACFQAKNSHYSNFYFLGNIGQENIFYDILERKNAFLGYKNEKFKKSKNCHLSKGVSPRFWSNIGLFSIFFLNVIWARKMCFTIFQNNKTFF